MNRSRWAQHGPLKVLKIAVFGALFIVVAGYATMSLWNWLVPVLFHGPVITFAQTLGLLLLSKILFGFRGGGGGGRWGRHGHDGPPWAKGREMWRQKMEARLATMTPEEREKYRERLRRCGMPWSRWTEEAEDTPAPSSADKAS